MVRSAGPLADGHNQALAVNDSCGYCCWRPRFLQALHNPKCLLFCLCLSSIAQGMLVNGFIPVSISTLEKRFSLSSTQSGVYSCMYEVGVILVLIAVCLFGGKGHKGHWIGCGMFLLGIGAIICIIPQFVIRPYRLTEDGSLDTCSTAEGNSLNSVPETEHLSNYFYVFLLGQLFHGFGAAPLYTLGITYLDENVLQQSSPMYTGIFLAFAVVGPAIGFVLGGALLNIYGDIGKVDVSAVKINNSDPRWYGAWWIGYLCSGVLALICCVPLLGFAHKLPGSEERRKKDINQAYCKSEADAPGFGSHLLDLPRSILLLLKNPTYVCLVLQQIFEGFLMNGFTTFMPKIVEQLFSISSSSAAMLTGSLVVPGGFLGNILGGYILKRWKMQCCGMILVGLASQVVAFLLLFVFFVRCEQPPFAGLTADVIQNNDLQSVDTVFSNNNVSSLPVSVALLSQFECNQHCQCSEYYKPMCSHSYGVVYYSPCHAGCTVQNNDNATYDSCACIDSGSGTVSPGLCQTNCKGTLAIFLAVFGLLVLTIFTAAIPLQQAQLRCVSFSQRNMAVGISSLAFRIFGSIPGVIAFGSAIDRVCLLWDKGQQTSGSSTTSVSSSCLLYNNKHLSYYVIAFGLGLKLAMISSLFFAWRFYKSRSAMVAAAPPPPTAVPVFVRYSSTDNHQNDGIVHLPTTSKTPTNGSC